MDIRRQTDIPTSQTILHADPGVNLTIRNGSASKSQLKSFVPAVQNRKAVELYSIVEDVSKGKRNQEMVLAYDTLEHSDEMIFWLNDDYSLFSANLTFCSLLGYAKKDIQKVHAGDFLMDFDVERFEVEWKQLEDRKEIRKEMLVKDKAGRSVLVGLRAALCLHNGRKLYCGILHDISERKRLQVQNDIKTREIENLRSQICQTCHVENENSVPTNKIVLKHSFENIISGSPKYKEILAQVEKVAPTNTTILITGETGTGKELLAHTIHKLSRRSHLPFISVNCASLSPTLIESELFGHEKGAFTGAVKQKKGYFELAHQKTLFLDEIGEIPLELQSKLLRVLQGGELERVGGTETIRVDVRIISATNRNLEEMLSNGRFREDLYYRLNVFPIHSIPLRERKEDIPLLIHHFIDKHSPGKKMERIPESIVNRLFLYDFPGNIRELENIVQRALVLSQGKCLNLNAAFVPWKRKQNGHDVFQTLEEMQKEHILKALNQTKWRLSGKMGAATLLGVNPKTLWSKIKKLGI